MKTSFYFVIWIIIYPLLGLLHSPGVDRNAFIIALVVVWGLSYFLNRSMPLTIRYEGALARARVMEEIYSGHYEAFRLRVRRRMWVQFVTALYFGVTVVFVVFSLLRQSDANDWFALVIFGLFAYGSVTSAARMQKAAAELGADPSEEACGRVAASLFNLNYADYRRRRAIAGAEGTDLSEMLPLRPPHFRAFLIFSLLVAVGCVVLGVLYLERALMGLILSHGAGSISGAIMYVLYGSLATYFGLRDTISLATSLRHKA